MFDRASVRACQRLPLYTLELCSTSGACVPVASKVCFELGGHLGGINDDSGFHFP
jgi:hypothetical protein